jgi:hypothetical protein
MMRLPRAVLAATITTGLTWPAAARADTVNPWQYF